jgi:hypothetical protein
MNLDHDEIK